MWSLSARTTLYFIAGLVIPLAVILVIFSFFMGVQLHLLDLQLFITLWAAEVPIAIVLRLFLREAKPASPLLSIEEWDKTDKKNVTVVSVLVRNRGDTVAASCIAKITLKDLVKEDIHATKGVQPKFSEKNFEPTISSDLNWGRPGMMQKSIRSDDTARLPVMRLVRSEGNASHYEIPSASGWRPVTIALRPGYFYGHVRVTPLNGKPIVEKFEISFNSETGLTWFNLI